MLIIPPAVVDCRRRAGLESERYGQEPGVAQRHLDGLKTNSSLVK